MPKLGISRNFTLTSHCMNDFHADGWACDGADVRDFKGLNYDRLAIILAFGRQGDSAARKKCPQASASECSVGETFETVNGTLGQISNTNQTPVYFDMPVAYTVNEKGTKEVKMRSAGYEKQRATVMLCCTADGHKLPPYIVFKRKTLPAKEAFPENFIVRANENRWMMATMVE